MQKPLESSLTDFHLTKMSNILIAYSTTDGHTRKICMRLQQIIESHNHQVTLHSLNDGNTIDLGSFDKIVIGASIRYGKHSKEVHKFIDEHLHILNRKPNAFFTVNVVARKPEKNTPETNPYLQKFLRRISWKPQNLAVFAGKIDYQRYQPLDRFMIRLIMWMTKGPTAPDTNIEFTDWSKVEDFAHVVSEMRRTD